MAPTSEERREVAARLRAYQLESVKADHKGEDPLQLPADVMYDLMDIAGVGEDFDSLLPSLADLIDPTCEVVGDNPYTSDFNYRCMACGEHFSTCGEPKYCPGCGGRIEHVK